MRKTLWKSKTCHWNHFTISYGQRNSRIFQWFPIWNMSANSERSLLFGFGFLYFQLSYYCKTDYYRRKEKSWFTLRPNEKEWHRFYRLIL